jgi:hypothetical protein
MDCCPCENINGTFYGNRYYDEKGTFSVEIPPQYRKEVEEHATDCLSCAIFHDCLGQIMRIEVTTLPDDITCQHDLRKLDNATYLSSFFKDLVVAPIEAQFPETKITKERGLREINGKQYYFALLSIPGGSCWTNIDTNETVDGYRGFLLSFEGNQIVILSHQPLVPPTGVDRADINEILKRMQNVRSTYRNELRPSV